MTELEIVKQGTGIFSSTYQEVGAMGLLFLVLIAGVVYLVHRDKAHLVRYDQLHDMHKRERDDLNTLYREERKDTIGYFTNSIDKNTNSVEKLAEVLIGLKEIIYKK